MSAWVKRAVVLTVLAAVCGLAGAQEKRGPSTPEERARFVAVAHKVEANPLDPSLKADARWALNFLVAVPDIDVSLCGAPLGGLIGSHYKYEAELFGEYALAMGAFVIEHPEKAKETAAVNLAGVESVLKAYQAIRKQNPQVTSADLDELVKKQGKGKLADAVREASKQCK